MNRIATRIGSLELRSPTFSVICCALILRLLHFALSSSFNPLVSSPILDSATYDRWARALVSGTNPPPTILMQAPIYPWFLSILYRLLEPSVAIARAAQALLGTATVGLVMYTTERFFSSARAGVIAGLFCALYAPLIFYEGILLPATIVVFLHALFLFLVSSSPRCSRMRILACGIVLGTAIAANPQSSLVIPFVILHFLLSPCLMERECEDDEKNSLETGSSSPKPSYAGRLFSCVIVCTGVATTLLPVAMRNYRESGHLTPLTTGGGINFYIGNNPGANGYYAVPIYKGQSLGITPEEQHRKMTYIAWRVSGQTLDENEVSNFWFGEGLKWIRSNRAQWAALSMQKFVQFWNRYERANVESYYFHKRFPGLLKLHLFDFGFIAPLALLGMFLALGKVRRLILLYGGVAASVATAIVFYVTSRYRLPILPFLMPFAAWGVCELWDALRRKSFAELALLLSALAILAALTNFTVAQDTPQGIATNLVRLGEIYLERGDTTKAAASFEEALELVPDFEPARRAIESMEAEGSL